MSNDQYLRLKNFLNKNANSIQKQATREHKKYLKAPKLRSEFIEKYQDWHIKIVEELANSLTTKSIDKSSQKFRELGEQIAKQAVQDGLTIEETVDGTIFLKQAIWQKLKKADILEDLSLNEFYDLSYLIGTLCDVVASRAAFIYHQERQHIETGLRFLAEASKILSSSLDYQATLNTVASLAVPEIADWCGVDILDNQKVLQPVAVQHKDPKKVKWAQELRKKYPTDMNAPTGLPNVIRTGQSEIYPYIPKQMIEAVAKVRGKEYLKIVQKIGFTSAIIVPLKIEGRTIGGITFVTAETSRHYNQSDLAVAEELAARASLAIENAILYKGSQEAIELRDNFISVASHELKTPVTSVKIFTQLLIQHSEQIGDQKAVSHLSKMDNQLNKLTELIYNLLNISKIQAGRIEFSKIEFDFDQFVYEIVDVLQQISPKHQIIIEGVTGKKIIADEERIGQVLNNLVTNAIKYSPKSDKVIIKLSSNKDNITVAVQDFGIGMAQEHLGRIFERFYRVYDSTDKTFPGMGIGLYITSEIIKRHGGRLWVESDLGVGSTFYFSLPTIKPATIRSKNIKSKNYKVL